MDLPGPDRAARDALLALAIAGLLVGLAAPAAAQTGGAPFALAQEQVDADAVFLSVDLQADGDARWQVEYRVRLDDENTTAAFEELQADVESNESAYVTRFEDRMVATVADAGSITDREMAVRNVSVATSVRQLPESYGVLTYRFEWTNFAAVDGNELRAGDALAGFFLDADSSLLVTWPDGYALVDATPEPTETRERGVVWRGPFDFGADGPQLVVSSAGAGVSPSLAGLAIVLLVLAGGGALWWWRNRESAEPAGDATGSPTTADTADGTDRPPEELLSNEERVIALLEEHGGRMKQQDVVQALDWTDAKTSQVVGKLRDAGEIEGFRLGRENVLRLPEVDESPAPGDVESGSDDEA